MQTKQSGSVWSQASSSVIDVVLLFLSFSIALNVRRIFHLSQTKISGIENTSNFSPESNYPTLLAVVAVTLLLFWGLKMLRSRWNHIFRICVAGILVFSFLVGAVAPTVASLHDHIDTFHHGEQLAPAVGFDQGKKPYEDLFFLRGAGEDVIIPWASFKIFGESIGSYLFFVGALQVLAMCLFLFLVSKLFKQDLEFLLVSLWFVLGSFSAFYYVRDLPVWVSLYLLVSIIAHGKSSRYWLGALGLISSLTLFYSVDRGIFLTGLVGLVLLALGLFETKKNGDFLFNPRSVRERLGYLATLAGGFVGGLTLGLALLGGDGFTAFLRTSFGEVAKYQGAIFNQLYPAFGPTTLMEWLPVLVISVIALAIIKTLYVSGLKSVSKDTMLEVIMFIFAIAFFRSATGRPDLGHVAYGSVVLLLVFFLVAFRRLREITQNKKNPLDPLLGNLPFIIILVFMFSPAFVNYYRLAESSQTPLLATRVFLKSPTKPDSYWADDRMESVSKIIQEKAGSKGSLFVFSSEPLFYYTTKLENPTRFSISWFADAPPLEDEMLSDLRSNPPDVIVYESGASFNDTPDYVSMRQRLPEVNQWILDNYHHETSVSGVKLLTRN